MSYTGRGRLLEASPSPFVLKESTERAQANRGQSRKKRMAPNHHLLLLLLAAIAAVGHVPRGATGVSLDHIVGGSFGWRLPPNDTFYQEWTQGRTFVVGDKLVFMYTPALQNVLEVSEKDFADCTQNNVVDMYYAGPTVLKITKPGHHFFYCGIGTHCEGGQKLSINVSATPVPDPARDGLPLAQAPGDSKLSDSEPTKSGAAGARVAGAVAGFLMPLSVWLFF